jgi:hypothetical protein
MSSSFHKMKKPIIILFAVIAMICAMAPARAERKYTFGTSLDFTSGVTNQLGESSFSLDRLHEGFVPFFSLYPGANFHTEGHRSNLIVNYTFSAERFQRTPRVTTLSHALEGSFGVQLGRTVHFRLSDTFDTLPDFSTINVMKGFIYTQEGFHYIFEPALFKSLNTSNTGILGLDVDVSPNSTLTFTAMDSHRFYDKKSGSKGIPDQFRLEGDLAFSHRTSLRQTWGFKYRVWQNDYLGDFVSRSHAVTLNLSRELSPRLHLTLEAGPSFSEKNKLLKSSVGYVVLAHLSKQIDKNMFTGGYSHRSGDSTGLGTVTESHQGTLGFTRTLGRKGSINFQGSAFKQHQKSTDIYDYWSAFGSATLSREIGTHWVASVGGSYMTNAGRKEGQNFTYRRIFASFGYRFPELFRGER